MITFNEILLSVLIFCSSDGGVKHLLFVFSQRGEFFIKEKFLIIKRYTTRFRKIFSLITALNICTLWILETPPLSLYIYVHIECYLVIIGERDKINSRRAENAI